MYRANGEVEKGVGGFSLNDEERALSGGDIWTDGPDDNLCEDVRHECTK